MTDSQDGHGPPDLSEEQKAMSRALMGQAWSYTRDLHETRTGENATGIPIAIGGRFFLATVGHFLAQASEIEIVRRPGEFAVRDTFLKRVFTQSPDVGLLELAEEDANRLAPFLTGANVLVTEEFQEERLVLVSGFPAAMHQRVPPRLVSLATHIGTTTLPSADWPENIDPPFDEEADFFVEFPVESDNKLYGPGLPEGGTTPDRGCPPAPPGLSGGGIWLRVWKNKPVCRPDMQLIGLQRAYFKGLGLLRGVKIACWLDLVVHAYPDLSQKIDDIKLRQFPLGDLEQF